VLSDSGIVSVGDPAGRSQAILGLAGLRSPLFGSAGSTYAEFSYLDQAYDVGYRVMDTAAVYGLGASEKSLGRWMQLRRNRDRVVIISKGGHPSLLRPGRHRITVESIASDLAASLRRLGTDHIDLYLLHRDAVECDIPAVMQYLHEQKRQGTVQTLGVSNWHHARIEAANNAARRLGVTEFSVSSPQFSLLSWNSPPWRGCLSISGSGGAEARSWYRNVRLPVLAWSPLGGGITKTQDGEWAPTGARYNNPANTERLRRAAAIARAKDSTVPQVLIAYLSSLPFLVHPICASRNVDHLRANRAVLDLNLKLSESEIRMLEGE
jgi:aryl-alcohol dehydrogenase-like predicted oxidoreductase